MRVRDARELAGLTQAALAEIADITTETVSRLERGLYDPAVSTLIALADALDLDLDYIMGRGPQTEGAPRSATALRLQQRIGELDMQAQRALLKVIELIPMDGAVVPLSARSRARGPKKRN